MNAWTIILDIVLILISIVLIIAVLLQQGQRQGLGAIAGGAETFFGKNKAKSYEAKMAKITKIGATVFIIAAIAATIVASAFRAGDTADVTDDTLVSTEEARGRPRRRTTRTDRGCTRRRGRLKRPPTTRPTSPPRKLPRSPPRKLPRSPPRKLPRSPPRRPLRSPPRRPLRSPLRRPRKSPPRKLSRPLNNR